MAKHRRLGEADPFDSARSDIWLPASLPGIHHLCNDVDGCWIFPRTGSFPCEVGREVNSSSEPAEWPHYAVHRWAWMVAHDRIHEPLPAKIAVRRRCHDDNKCKSYAHCIHTRCCNPTHLYLSLSGSSEELTVDNLEKYLSGEYTPGLVLSEDLDEVASLCEVQQQTGCWLFTKRSVVACRANNDRRPYIELPKLSPHRWTWAVANGRAEDPLPSNRFNIRRRCGSTACCNPSHLFLTAVDGTELALEEAEKWIASGYSRWQDALGGEQALGATPRLLGIVFGEDLTEIASMCEVDDASGCWCFTRRTLVPCRAIGDTRTDQELPKLAPHRWTWTVAYGRPDRQLGSHANVRRRCGNTTCCNPDHLYLTEPGGREISPNEAYSTPAVATFAKDEAAPVSANNDAAALVYPADDEWQSDQSHQFDVDSPKQFGPPTGIDGQGASRRLSAIQRAYAQWISTTCPAIESAAESLALAVHPWPEGPLSHPVIGAIVAELNPSADLVHPDICEVAADRLLRISESIRDLGAPELAGACAEAAGKLDEVPRSSHYDAVRCGALLGPLFRRQYRPMNEPPRGSRDYVATQKWPRTSSDGSGPHTDNASLRSQPLYPATSLDPASSVSARGVALILCRVATSRSRDIGVLLGAEPIGFDVGQIVASCSELEQLHEFDHYIGLLPERERDILGRRLFTLDTPMKLEALGDRWGVTRERVRQIARRLEQDTQQRFGQQLVRLAASLFEPLLHVVIRKEDLLSLLHMAAEGTDNPELVCAALVRIQPSWMFEKSWGFTAETSSKLSASIDGLIEGADGYWSVNKADALQCLGKYFLGVESLDDYLQSSLGWVEVQERWSLRGSKRNRIATALRAIGRPATKQEIATAAGIKDASIVGSQLSNLPGIVRADKDRWAYAGWVEDPYDGIVGEINQRIDEQGGSVSVDLLLDELPTRFGVSESSVRTYIATDAFVLSDGKVSRNTSEYVAGDPRLQANVVQADSHWGQRILLHQRHFEGYSLGVSFDIAYANGVRPGDDLLVPVGELGSSQASVIWQRHNPSRTVFVGRLSATLESMGCSPGDEIVVVPRIDGVDLIVDQPDAVLASQGNDDGDQLTTDSGAFGDTEGSNVGVHLSVQLEDPLLKLLGDT